MPLLQRGLRGEPVRLLQEKLAIAADGIFRAGTHKALRDYQSSNGLAVDGIAGPDTFASMRTSGFRIVLYESKLLFHFKNGYYSTCIHTKLS